MQLTVQRTESSSTTTVGELFVDGVFECYTLEDTVRDLKKDGSGKVYGKTAIPAGTYNVSLTQSARFKRVLPLVLNVPFFEGVRIHPGNTAADTDGCVLVGTTKVGQAGKPCDFIGNSRVAFDRLFAKLTAAKSITLTIKNEK